MGNDHKPLFWPIEYSTLTCSLCQVTQVNMWLYLLLCCQELHIHKLITNRQNKAVHEIHKFLISSSKSKCIILMIAGKYNGNPLENIVPN